MIFTGTSSSTSAVVVFTGQTDLILLGLLAPGFRHCFAALRAETGWVVVNPLAHRTAIEFVPLDLCDAGGDIAPLYRRHGLTVIETTVAEPPRRLAPVRPYTCVEVVKRLLGRRAPGVITPRQLHEYLRYEKKYLEQEKKLDDVVRAM